MLKALLNLFTRQPSVQIRIADAQFKKIYDETKAKYLFTPDHQYLMLKEKHLVFIYNECQKGQKGFKHLGFYDEKLNGFGAESDVEMQGAGFTVDEFLLYKKKLGKETFPFALKIDSKQVRGGFKGAFPHKISGQVFTLKPHCIVELDNYMLNTVQFNRKLVQIQIRYQKLEGSVYGPTQTEIITAYMYIGKAPFWLEQIDVQPERYGVCREQLTNSGKEKVGMKPDYYYFFNENFENK
jgi:hypothetical protein